MKKLIRSNDCECEDMGKGPLIDRIWESQLAQKEIIINQEIDSSIIEKAVLQIFNINQVDDEMENERVGFVRSPIIIFINSNGGYIDEAFSLISAIESSVTPVHTVVLGKAYSAGFLILLAGHKRFAQKYSSIMYHQGQSGNQGEFSKMIEYAEYWKKKQNEIETYVASKSKISNKKLKEIFQQKQDWYMTSKEALDLGVIDEII